jgi:hypothetical protein
MGFIGTRRLQQFAIPCEWTWSNSEKDEAKEYRGVSRGVGDNSASEATLDWKRLVRREERSLAETRRR